MEKSESIMKFEEVLNNDPEKKKKYEDILKRITEEKSAKSDVEAIVKAAGELGFDISMEEFERSFADKQEVEDEELDEIAGGGREPECAVSYYCDMIWVDPIFHLNENGVLEIKI